MCQQRLILQMTSPGGLSPTELGTGFHYNSGPKFLYESAELWPENKVRTPCKNNDMKEEKMERWTEAAQKDKVLLGWKKYSSLTKLRRVTAYVMRFANNVRVTNEACLLGALTSNEPRAVTVIARQ